MKILFKILTTKQKKPQKTIHLVTLKSSQNRCVVEGPQPNLASAMCRPSYNKHRKQKDNFINYMATLITLLRSEASAAKYYCYYLQKICVIYINLLL